MLGCEPSVTAFLKRRLRWPSRTRDARLFENGVRFHARNDNPFSMQPLLRRRPCSATVCHAAGERRAMLSWDGWGRALDGLENYARLLAAC